MIARILAWWRRPTEPELALDLLEPPAPRPIPPDPTPLPATPRLMLVDDRHPMVADWEDGRISDFEKTRYTRRTRRLPHETAEAKAYRKHHTYAAEVPDE